MPGWDAGDMSQMGAPDKAAHIASKVEDIARLRANRLIELCVIRRSQRKRDGKTLTKLPKPFQPLRHRIFDDQVVTLEVLCYRQEACRVRIGRIEVDNETK